MVSKKSNSKSASKKSVKKFRGELDLLHKQFQELNILERQAQAEHQAALIRVKKTQLLEAVRGLYLLVQRFIQEVI